MTFVNYSSHVVNPIASGPLAAAQPAAARTDGGSSFGDFLDSLDPFSTPPTASGAAADDDSHLTLGDLVDVVNPLQHIPVVSTLYRAITGDTIKTIPKIAGDALYGGWLGLASSVADTAFEKITGKDVGDTILGYAENVLGLDKPQLTATAGLSGPAPVDLASLGTATPSLDTPATIADAAPAPPVPGQDALMQALSRNGISQDVALRAADAYRRSLSAPAQQGTLN